MLRPLTLILIVLLAVACSKSERNQEHETYWGEVRSADSADQYEQYLKLHPDGVYREEALSRLVVLASERQRQLQEGRGKFRKRESTVSSVQARLNELGFSVGPADGVVGPRTRNAIAMFERQTGRSFDGKINRKLLAALLAATPINLAEASPRWLEKAKYPEQLMALDSNQSRARTCAVRLRISTAGITENIAVISQRCRPENYMASATIAAAEQSRFRPRTVNGIPEAVDDVVFTAHFSAESCQSANATVYECRVSVEIP